ncbi:MAG: mediator of RNA polymerase II transcription subunit 13 [Peltula sp. TS41687]|nr:MAG: mediator of RNA polymerase II transcription subunit 13 [Peltula sp. TS41687]
MDFPNGLLTGVLKVDNYQKVCYSIYEVIDEDHATEASNPPGRIWTGPNNLIWRLSLTRAFDDRHDALLRRLEASCRKEKKLVTAVFETRQLWLFGDEAHSKDPLKGLGILWDDTGTTSEVDGLKIQKVKAGILNSAALGPQTSKSSSNKTNPSSAPPAPATFEQNVSASRSANARAAPGNMALSATIPTTTMPTDYPSQDGLDGSEDPAYVYMHFIASVVSLLLYGFAESLGCVPLSGRTLARSLSPPDDGGLGNVIDAQYSRSTSMSVTTFDVRLTTTGALLIAPQTVLLPGLVSLAARARMSEERNPYRGAQVWLAPGGRSAVCPCTDPPPREIPRDGYDDQDGPSWDAKLARPGASIGPGDALSRWKETVILWLEQKGIHLEKSRDVWARVSVVASDRTIADDSRMRTILWPEALCFEQGVTETTDTVVEQSHLDGLIAHQKWLPDPLEHFSPDPLAFAERWYAGREARQEKLRLKMEARQAEKIVMNPTTAVARYKSEEIPAMTGLAVKQNTTGDMAAASVVYPTPPDGVQVHTLSGISSFDPTETPTGNVLDSLVSGTDVHSENALEQRNPDGSPMDIDVWPVPEGTREGAHERKQSSATVFELGSGNFSTGDGGAFFGHLDEDMFNEIGVTEADFSFFDDPDLGEDDLFGEEAGSRQGINGNPSAINELNDVFGSPSTLQMRQDRNSDLVQISDARKNTGPTIQAGAIQHSEHQNPVSIQSGARETLAKLNRHGTASLQKGNDSSRDLQHSLGLPHDAKGQFMSPPLSPDVVMKKLLPERAANSSQAEAPYRLKSRPQPKEQQGAKKSDNKPNGFDPIEFNRTLDDTKEKYDIEGRFWFSPGTGTKAAGTRDDETLPRLGPCTTRRESASSPAQTEVSGSSRGLTPADSEISSEVTDVCYAQNDSTEYQTHTTQTDTFAEDYSPQEGSSHLKRKRNIEDDGHSMVSSLQQLAFDPSRSLPEHPTVTLIPLNHLEPDPADESMVGVLSMIEPEGNQTFELGGKQYIQTAQIVADQFLPGSLNSTWEGNYPDRISGGETLLKDVFTHNRHYSSVEVMVQELFPQATECDLQSYVAIEDAQPVHPVCAPEPFSRQNPRANRTSSNSKNHMSPSSSSNPNIFKIQSPHILVQRGETRLQILPSALHFWESFGLGPCGGPKDITSFCVYPSIKSIEESVEDFLERMGSAYESCRLGRHRRGDVVAYNGGCVPVRINAPDPGGTVIEATMQAIKDTCLRLGKYPSTELGQRLTFCIGELLPNLDVEPQNVVIYLINPFSHKDAIVDLCFAFMVLSLAYLESPVVQQSKKVCEVVLQVVPLSFVFSDVTVPVPTPSQFFNLALEVYERCSLRVANANDQVSFSGPSPAVFLAQSIPGRINFKLSSEPPQSLLDESCCLHIAYSRSADGRWVSVAWSDSHGELQSSASFCIAKSLVENHYKRSFSDIAREVWETSVEMIQCKQAAWRFILGRVGVMGPDEIRVWISLASQPTQPPNSLVLVSADPCPPVSLHTRTTMFAPNDFTPQPGTYTTPASTPQANASSSDSGTVTNGLANAGHSIDLAAELEGDATIVDQLDEVWAVILNHRLRNSTALIDFLPALASGLLVKRGGLHEEDSPVCLGVNILHAYQSYRPLLKEILSMYRGLYTLTRFRGAPDSVKSVLPWHIATAIKAQEALSSLM